MNAFTLKIIATALMVIDHIAEFVPGMPIWMHWIGRASSPIFLFLCGWSCEFTRSRPRYALRLYIGGLLMSLLQSGLGIGNNIFTTLLQVVVIISLLHVGTLKGKLCGIALYTLYQCLLIAAFVLFGDALGRLPHLTPILTAATGSVVGLEGGLFYVVIGVTLWATRQGRIRLAAGFIGLNALFSLVLSPMGARLFYAIDSWILLTTGEGPSGPVMGTFHSTLEMLGISFFNMGASPLTTNYQWMMVLALPLMLLYDRRRGPNVTWFFYAFYPLHILLLYGIGMMLPAAPSMQTNGVAPHVQVTASPASASVPGSDAFLRTLPALPAPTMPDSGTRR